MARTPEQCLEQLYHGNSSCAHRNPVRNARCSLSQVLCVEKGKKKHSFASISTLMSKRASSQTFSVLQVEMETDR